MKRTASSRLTLFASLGVVALAAAGCSKGQVPEDGHGHAHEEGDAHEHEPGHGDEHAHEGEGHHPHDDEDHEHSHGEGEHQHAAGTGEPTLGFSLTETPAAGEAVTFSLILNGPDGEAVSADDIAATHGEKLHVMLVDEGLEDFVSLHPEAGADGLYQITFTPEYPRTYRLWTHYALADGEDAHSHDAEDDHHHDDGASAAGAEVVMSEALIVGEEDAPALSGEDILTASAGGLEYELTAASYVRAGEPVTLVVSVTDTDGAAFEALEPLMGAYGQLVGFSQGATSIVRAHPTGDHPHGGHSRGGPALRFETTFDEAGPHRLFLRTKADGKERIAAVLIRGGL
jgi:hypothetical protein